MFHAYWSSLLITSAGMLLYRDALAGSGLVVVVTLYLLLFWPRLAVRFGPVLLATGRVGRQAQGTLWRLAPHGDTTRQDGLPAPERVHEPPQHEGTGDVGGQQPETEADLSAAKIFIDNLIAAGSSVFFQTGPDLTPTYVSPNVTMLSGYTIDEACALDFWIAHIYPDDLPTIRKSFATALRNKSPRLGYSCRFIRKDGSVRWILCEQQFLWDGGRRLRGTQGIIHDVTERREIEAVLRLREEHLRLMIDSVQDYAIIMLDTAGHVVEWNPGAQLIKGYTPAEITGRHFSVFYTPEDRASDLPGKIVRRAALEGRVADEGWRVRKDGSRFWASLVISAVRDSSGQLIGFVKVTRDRTDQKLAEEERRAREAAEQANQAKSEFLSRMSHELRTPLNSILGFAQVLQMDDLAPEQEEAVGFIADGGTHLLNLINEVLDISRIESGNFNLSLEAVSLADMLSECIDLISPIAAKHEITILMPSAETMQLQLLADQQRLKQVLLNLLSNAVKYNHRGGSISLETMDAAKAGWVRLAVRDSGPGIAASLLPRLFKPFERLDAEREGIEGTGLGLSLSKALAEAMGGTIGVQSELGQGSSFWIELALAEHQPEQPLPKLWAPTTYPASNHTILYIEDNPANVRLIESVIGKRPGWRLLVALSGGLGTEMAQAHQPDLILLDLNLPDEHGEQVLRRLKRDPRTQDITVVVTSADASPRQIGRLLAGGAKSYLTKPLDLAKLLSTLEENLAAK